MPLDGGNLLLSPEQKDELLQKEPIAGKFIKRVIGSQEFIHNEERWCLWLLNAEPAELRKLPLILERLEKVRKFRLASIAPSTQKFANIPSLFRDTKVYDTYLVIPGVSSENRKYIPIGFLTSETIPTNLVHIVPNGTLFHFGVLTSEMHMTWVRYICGRLKSDFRYSKDIVYNNFPRPENPTQKQKETIEKAAQKVLDIRASFLNSPPGEEGCPDFLSGRGGLSANNHSGSAQKGTSLADLYNPLTMPPGLVKAHNELDKAVDLAYRPQPFANETKRIEYLFELYDKYTAGLFAKEKKQRRR